MSPLTMEELCELRAEMASSSLSDDDLDAYIRLVDSILISIIDQNNGRHSVQLSLSARANYAFRKAPHSGLFLADEPHQDVASDTDYAINRKINPPSPEPG